MLVAKPIGAERARVADARIQSLEKEVLRLTGAVERAEQAALEEAKAAHTEAVAEMRRLHAEAMRQQAEGADAERALALQQLDDARQAVRREAKAVEAVKTRMESELKSVLRRFAVVTMSWTSG